VELSEEGVCAELICDGDGDKKEQTAFVSGHEMKFGRYYREIKLVIGCHVLALIIGFVATS
jgi:hypothetical protein